ncbi:MAG: minichromosome maintenance protein MCM [Natronomonas sp.]|nr:minichromosome maintenance protein MCM [Natronomonas sp.]
MTTQAHIDHLDTFESFLQTYYRDEIGRLVQRYPKDQQSIEVSWRDLSRHDADLADDYLAKPDRFGNLFDEALSNIDVAADVSLDGARVRVVDLPEHKQYNVGEYRTDNRGEYLSISGQVARRTGVKPIAKELAFECQRCGTISKIPQIAGEFYEPHECQGCERQGPFTTDLARSTLADFQVLRLQRPPELAAKGTGETVDVQLEGELTGNVEPGDRIDIDGVLKARQENDTDATFEYYVETGAVEPKETSYEDIEIEPYIDEIHELAADNPHEQLVDSFAPGIHGYEEQKLAIILQMFSGVRSEYPGGDADRGSIHILLLGDPGTAKSSLLRAASELSPRSAFASGKGSSAAGLTAGVKSDDFGHERYSLEAGAMVVANEGLACIDELDKVDEEVRSSLHTALEQQVVEVSKIIQASMPARTSLLAAGNPKWGRFDQYEPLGEQITLGPALMSRFDLMFMITDDPDEETDRELSNHIIEMKDRATRWTHDDGAGADDIEPDLDEDLIRAYIAYARQYVHPRFDDSGAKEALREFYVSLRSHGYDEDSPVPVTARKLEAGIRLAEASARIRLSNTITMEDVERAKMLVMSSLEDVGIDHETDEYDADIVESGQSHTQRERKKTLKAIIDELDAEHERGAPVEEILDAAEEAGLGRSNAEYELDELRSEGQIYSPATDCYKTS